MTEAPRSATRQEALAALVLPDKPAADIGTDHGYLPIALLKQGKIPRAIAADLRPGPLAYARSHRDLAGLSDEQMELRLGSGLSPLRPHEVKSVIIAGMGGATIAQILEDDDVLALHIERLILQPNIGQRTLRHTLWARGLNISDELLVYEAGRFYPILVVDLPPDATQRPPAEDADWAFGQQVRARADEVFIAWLHHERQRLLTMIKGLERATRGVEAKRLDAHALLELVNAELARLS